MAAAGGAAEGSRITAATSRATELSPELSEMVIRIVQEELEHLR
jgi:hypothetical protein